MEGCTESEALAYLQNAFSSHFGFSTSLASINDPQNAYPAQCARRIQQSPSPENEAPIPDSLIGSRRHYLEAVQRTAIAKKRYQSAIASVRQRPLPIGSDEQSDPARHNLFAHLELLRQQKWYEKLGVLEKYLSELNQLDDELKFHEHTHEPQGQLALRFDSSKTDPAADFSILLDMVTELEIAVVRATSDAKREKAQLEAVQANANPPKDLDPVREAQALVAVRDELTQWLEQNLAFCADSGEDATQEAIEDDDAPRITQEDVSNQYEKYLIARQRLLNASARLESPMEAATGPSPARTANPVARQVPTADDAFLSETQHFRRQLDQAMKHIKKYLEEELSKEKQESLEGLLRLVDESQLLPLYPMLVKHERFSRIVSSLGGRSGPLTDDMFTHQIEAWAFAADAADKTLEASLSTQVARATRALDEVEEMLHDLRILKEHASG